MSHEWTGDEATNMTSVRQQEGMGRYKEAVEGGG